MNDNKNKRIYNIIALIVLGVITVVFSFLLLSSFSSGFFYKNKITFLIISIILLLGLAGLGIISLIKNKEFLFKLSLTILVFTAICLSGFYLLKVTGVFNKIKTVNELRNWVASFGAWMPIIYIVLNVLQVIVLPIPCFVAVASGVALFGPTLATLYAFIGIMLGSIIGYFIGKKLGYNVVKWLVGKETLDKWLLAVKNKDRIVLTYMFFFPLFPDDVLCFIAGMSSMSTRYFIVMVTISRLITISVTAYSLNGSLIPYNTWWGILIWCIILVVTVIFTIILYKYGDKVELKLKQFIKNKFKRNKNDKRKSNTTR